MRYTGPMMTDGGGESIPADLETDPNAAAEKAKSTSANSYTKTIRMVPVKDKTYKFFFTYLHEDEETKLITESERSPAYLVQHVIENGTLPVKNLTLTSGFKSYGVKFDLDPLSTQDDVVIFESLTSDFAVQNIVYVGTSTNVTIQASSYAPRWVKVRSRDRWDDLNISEVTAGPVEILNSEIDTTKVPKAPTGVAVTPSIDPEDKSGFSIKIDVSWTASTDADTNGYVIRWSPNNPATVTNPLWEYGQVDGKATTKFSITGLTPNTVYYWQVTAKSPFNSISWNTGIAGQVASGSFGPVSDPNAPEGNVQLRSILSIGGKTADLFKIGTGIAQSINTSTTITPTQTAGTYNGIILDRSTTNFGHNYWLNTGQFRVGSASSFLYWDGSDVYTTGKINATGGTFTGNLRVTTGSIIAGGTFAQDGTVSGARVVMQSGGLYAHDAAGAQSVFIQSSDGLIDARKGYIGGWTLNGTSKTVGSIESSNTKIESNGVITLGDTTGTLPSIVRLSATDPNYRLWVGSQVAANAKFKVGIDGTLYATNAVLGTGSSIAGYVTNGSFSSTLANYVTGDTLSTTLGSYVTSLGLTSTLNSYSTSAQIALAYLPTTGFDKVAILRKLNAGTNGATLNGGILEARTIAADALVADYVYTGLLTGNIIRTQVSTTFPRISLNEVFNQLTFHTNSGSLPGSIEGLGSTTYGQLRIQAPRPSGYQAASMTLYTLDDVTTTIMINSDLAWFSQGAVFGSGIIANSGTSYFNKMQIGNTIYANDLGVYNGTNGYPVRQVYGSGTGGNAPGFLRVQTSSRKHKKNIEPFPEDNYIDMLTRLNPVRFNDLSENDDDPKAIGLIAEEVAEIQELRYGLAPIDEDGNPVAVHYELVGVLLIMALKEIKEKLNAIENRLDALES
jgi:hypothetical protein